MLHGVGRKEPRQQVLVENFDIILSLLYMYYIVQVLRYCFVLRCICDLGPSHLNCLGSSGGRALV